MGDQPTLIKIIHSFQWREELLEEEPRGTPENRRCPVIEMRIEGITVRALVDSGSQVSCISQEFYDRHITTLQNCPFLPVVGVSVVGATKGKPVKLKKQLFVKITLESLLITGTLLVVPELSRECIVGVDMLRPLDGRIDLGDETLTVKSEDRTYIIPTLEEEDKDQPFCGAMKMDAMDSEEELSEDKLREVLRRNNEIHASRLGAYEALIWKFREVFNKRPGRIPCHQHRLRIKDDVEPRSLSYPPPIYFEGQTDNEIGKMLRWNIIRRGKAHFVNPIVVTPKKDGKVRLCLDARNVNRVLEDDHDGTEPMEVLFQRCLGKRVFSRLDLNMSFWQVPLHEDSQKYTAFLYKGKTYVYLVTPFGLKTSTGALIRALEIVLAGLEYCVIPYVDDLLIVSENESDHLKHIELVLERIRENNITLNIDKFEFEKGRVNFLGHVISAKGTEPDPDKIQAIRDYNSTRTKKQLQGFLGTVNFCSKFTEKFAREVVPLLELLRKGNKWSWEPRHEEAFSKVKNLFSSWVLLQFPDPKREFFLQTDASDYALGAVIYQLSRDGKPTIITCASRTLRGAEIAYNTTEKELLALVWILLKYRNFLAGAKIIHKTDHMALTFLRKCRLLSGRLMRWTLAIQDFNVVIEYCPGKDNIMADALSRYTSVTVPEGVIRDKCVTICPLAGSPSGKLLKKLKSLQIEQMEDARISNLLARKDHHEKIKFENGLVYRRCGEMWKVFLPESVLSKLVSECHVIYGHIGSRKCLLMIQESFYYPNLCRSVKKLLKTCLTCQKNKVATQASYHPYQPIVCEKPLEILFIDYYGPLPSSTFGYKYVLAILDGFTKFVRLYGVRRQTTAACIKKLFSDYIPKYGKPLRVVTDHGTQFTSGVWREKLVKENISHILTSIRHPQSNMVERVNREISKFLRILLDEHAHSGWFSQLLTVETLINEVHHETTDSTPTELMTGKKPTRFWEKWARPLGLDGRFPDLQSKLMWVGNKIRAKGERRAKLARQTRRVGPSFYETGDSVFIKAYNLSDKSLKRSAKLMAVYESPYPIERVLGKGSYEIAGRGTFNAKDIKRAYIPTNQVGP